MCIIVDTNVLTNVFNRTSVNHAEFKPVLDWVLEGNGMFIYGGSKYLEEVGKTKYMPIILELGRSRKAKNIDRDKVDAKQVWATAQIQHMDFDDQHLVGLLLESGCKLICSLDARAYPFFTHSVFFSPAAKRPKIYSRISNATLLKDRNIANVCKPIFKLTGKQREQFN